MGSRLQVSYTAIGDTVNVAARLEPLNKEFGTGILISEQTRAGLGEELATEFKGELQVKGRAEPVRVYAVQMDARVARDTLAEARRATGRGTENAKTRRGEEREVGPVA
jgi:class 3 adenylate cyclase